MMVVTFLSRFVFGTVIKRFVSLLPGQIWAALAVVIVLGASAWYINDRAYDRGFAEADAQWRVVVIEERERQSEANEQAAKLAKQTIARLNEAKGVRDATIARLEREAAQDVDAGRVAIGSGSVRRLNQVD